MLEAPDLTAAHYKSGFGFMFANSGLSVIAPPWTTLTAYDLNSVKFAGRSPWVKSPSLRRGASTIQVPTSQR